MGLLNSTSKGLEGLLLDSRLTMLIYSKDKNCLIVASIKPSKVLSLSSRTVSVQYSKKCACIKFVVK